MKKYIPYLTAAYIGLFLRTIMADLKGWECYTLDGHDVLNLVFCIAAVWTFKWAFLSIKKECEEADDVQCKGKKQSR